MKSIDLFVNNDDLYLSDETGKTFIIEISDLYCLLNLLHSEGEYDWRELTYSDNKPQIKFISWE